MTTRAPLPDATPTTVGTAPPLVRTLQRLESWGGADSIAGLLGSLSGPLGHEPLRGLLLGRGSGHAVHPVLTDLAIGFWTSSASLDLLRRGRSDDASRALVGWGVLSALPTAVTGLAEWRETSNPERRVGAVHATANAAATALYAVSWGLRRGGRQKAGVAAGLAATSVATVGAYLGGHLATARKVGSRDAAYEVDGVGPQLRRPTAP